MPSSANPGEPGSEQELDLAAQPPSPGSYRLPVDRISVAVRGRRLGGRTDIAIKGSLRPAAEYVMASAVGVLSLLATAGVCRIAGLEGVGMVAASLVVGAGSYATGLWHLIRRRRHT